MPLFGSKDKNKDKSKGDDTSKAASGKVQVQVQDKSSGMSTRPSRGPLTIPSSGTSTAPSMRTFTIPLDPRVPVQVQSKAKAKGVPEPVPEAESDEGAYIEGAYDEAPPESDEEPALLDAAFKPTPQRTHFCQQWPKADPREFSSVDAVPRLLSSDLGDFPKYPDPSFWSWDIVRPQIASEWNRYDPRVFEEITPHLLDFLAKRNVEDASATVTVSGMRLFAEGFVRAMVYCQPSPTWMRVWGAILGVCNQYLVTRDEDGLGKFFMHTWRCIAKWLLLTLCHEHGNIRSTPSPSPSATPSKNQSPLPDMSPSWSSTSKGKSVKSPKQISPPGSQKRADVRLGEVSESDSAFKRCVGCGVPRIYTTPLFEGERVSEFQTAHLIPARLGYYLEEPHIDYRPHYKHCQAFAAAWHGVGWDQIKEWPSNNSPEAFIHLCASCHVLWDDYRICLAKPRKPFQRETVDPDKVWEKALVDSVSGGAKDWFQNFLSLNLDELSGFYNASKPITGTPDEQANKVRTLLKATWDKIETKNGQIPVTTGIKVSFKVPVTSREVFSTEILRGQAAMGVAWAACGGMLAKAHPKFVERKSVDDDLDFLTALTLRLDCLARDHSRFQDKSAQAVDNDECGIFSCRWCTKSLGEETGVNVVQ